LHDGLGPSLTGVGLGLQALDDAVAAEDRSRAHELTAVLRDEVSGAVTEVHRILEDLRPAPLAEHGLARALTSRLGTTPVPVDISVDLLPSLPGAVEDALNRVALEAVTNVVRHAGATRVSVDVGAAGGTVRLRVDDDGAGFAPDALPGVGLASMRQRATALGGTLDVATGPAGTTLTMAVPLAVSPAALAGTGP
jgi:signal transduction histidine kinase